MLVAKIIGTSKAGENATVTTDENGITVTWDNGLSTKYENLNTFKIWSNLNDFVKEVQYVNTDWTVQAYSGADFTITGINIIDAIEKNFNTIAHQARLGNAAGYEIHTVTAEYKDSILGGKGGVELIIIHSGQPLANKKTEQLHPHTEKLQRLVWIYASKCDLLQVYNFNFKS